MPIKTGRSGKFTVQQFEKALLRQDRVMLGKALTLVESNLPKDRLVAEALLEKILPKTGKSIRIGITGVPGVGKSTFIEAFGQYLTSIGKKLAVLVIDPSSQKTKGSILGDKTRMEKLSRDPHAFIRPTPTGGSLGGVTNGTRKSILICEAAGYDVILIETVGVGQSEVAVHGMVDFFLLLMLAGAGDELQGIKKGIMEMADGIAITKADGENVKKATRARADFQQALHWARPPASGWTPKVLTVSAQTATGIIEIWDMIESYRLLTLSNGFFLSHRNQQKTEWLYQSVDTLIKNKLTSQSQKLLAPLEQKVLANKISPDKAARQVIKKLLK